MEYRKEIHPHYEQCGRRKKLTGYDGLLFDGDILIHDKEYSTYGQAETALNALVYDLLMDLTERGLSETVPQSGDWIEVEGMRVMAPTDEPAILDDIVDVLSDTAQAIDMALGRMRGAESVVDELRRVRARIGQVQARATVLG